MEPRPGIRLDSNQNFFSARGAGLCLASRLLFITAQFHTISPNYLSYLFNLAASKKQEKKRLSSYKRYDIQGLIRQIRFIMSYLSIAIINL